ncbi:GNAT family N-acetyltransferase [Halorubrum sp. AD140]|uniref:GNAT family N-acetyltransferase n=1 Tax=Halorubrum sp. AD140 TaxID=3050073 RepID=UPI002ACC9DAF|nr:GNAT family N-acetyltransferase [Halorubrum sp. AD140]MDZ5810235.1 GNAT family N-acetyltransferase [Halorubrum sp. AD140]
MSVDVQPLTDPESWDRLVQRAPAATPFHRHAALEVVADHTSSELHPLVGYVGEEPAGLFPVFERRFGPVVAAFSPPPNRKLTYMGPATLADPNMKRRKRERRHLSFVESAMAYVDEEIAPRYVSVRTSVEYGDPRPFLWNDFDPTPRYTYHVDLSGDADTLLSEMGSDLRSNVRNTASDAFEIERGGLPEMEQIVVNAKRRHDEQGVAYDVTPSLVRDLARAIPDQMRAYVCTVDDVFAGGTLLLTDEDTVYRWQSVADFDAPVPAQDLLDWHVIERARESGIDRYDLVGANNRRLCRYKAKFAPTVETYYRLERCGPVMNLLTDAYARLR